MILCKLLNGRSYFTGLRMTVAEIMYVTLRFLQYLLIKDKKRTNGQHIHLLVKEKFKKKKEKNKKEVKKRMRQAWNSNLQP